MCEKGDFAELSNGKIKEEKPHAKPKTENKKIIKKIKCSSAGV